MFSLVIHNNNNNNNNNEVFPEDGLRNTPKHAEKM